MVFDFRGAHQFPTRYAHGHVRRYSTCHQHNKLFTRRQIQLVPIPTNKKKTFGELPVFIQNTLVRKMWHWNQ
jgi:hypothetical protein